MNGLRRLRETLWSALRNFVGDHCLDHAAAVSFYSLLSLVPLLYLLLVTLRWIWPAVDAPGILLRNLDAVIPPESRTLFAKLADSLGRSGKLVVLALPALIWVATTAFSALDDFINVAFGRRGGRSFWVTRFKAVLNLALVALLLVGSLLALHALAWLDSLRARAGLPPALDPRALSLSRALSHPVAWAAFSWLYKFLPRCRVPWRTALSAGFAAWVLWETTRAVFDSLLAWSATYGLLPGTLAGTVSFLLWVYTVVVIVLYGAEVAALQCGARKTSARPPRAA